MVPKGLEETKCDSEWHVKKNINVLLRYGKYVVF